MSEPDVKSMPEPGPGAASRAARVGRSWVVVALVAFCALAWRLDFVCDDAYISFRYAKRFAAGEGLSFNPGRVPPVEGYSNFLWVVWLSVFERLGVDIALAARATSGLCAALLVLLFARQLEHGRTRGPLGLLAFATLPPITLWATGGLASAPLALATFVAWRALAGATPRAGVAALACLTAGLLRADGVLFAGLVLVSAGADAVLPGAPAREERRARLRAVLIAGLVLAAGVGLHFLWRHSVYGQWVPQTARVKAGASADRVVRGLDYVVAWFLLLPQLAAAPLALWVALRSSRLAVTPTGPPSVPRAEVCGLLFIALPIFVYATYVGGDFMPYGRFLLPAVPFLGLGLARSMAALPAPAGQLAGAGALALSLLASFDLNVVPSGIRQQFNFRPDRAIWQTELERRTEMQRNVEKWRFLGRAVAMHTTAGESIVMGPIGVMGYHTELFLYDEYGLVTPEVLEIGSLRKGASPGHDYKAALHEFFRYEPTYVYALIRSLDHVGGAELPWWADQLPVGFDETHPIRQAVDIESHPLSPQDGFPERAELLLLRYKGSGR